MSDSNDDNWQQHNVSVLFLTETSWKQWVHTTNTAKLLPNDKQNHNNRDSNKLVHQATDTGMIVNSRKTKEMLIGPVLKDPPPSVSLSGAPVDRVTVFKLLVVHVASDLKWSHHVDVITSKASARLHFLKQLKRSGAGSTCCVSTAPWSGQSWSMLARCGTRVLLLRRRRH